MCAQVRLRVNALGRAFGRRSAEQASSARAHHISLAITALEADLAQVPVLALPAVQPLLARRGHTLMHAEAGSRGPVPALQPLLARRRPSIDACRVPARGARQATCSG
jgi:hypothetical protein